MGGSGESKPDITPVFTCLQSKPQGNQDFLRVFCTDSTEKPGQCKDVKLYNNNNNNNKYCSHFPSIKGQNVMENISDA